MTLRGRSHTKPVSLLKSQIPIRTWAQWDDSVPGFVEIDPVAMKEATRSVITAIPLTVDFRPASTERVFPRSHA